MMCGNTIVFLRNGRPQRASLKIVHGVRLVLVAEAKDVQLARTTVVAGRPDVQYLICCVSYGWRQMDAQWKKTQQKHCANTAGG